MLLFNRRLTVFLFSTLFCSMLGITSAQAENRDEVIFFFNDALGSAVAAVNEAGELCWSEEYTAYGDKSINDDVFSITGCGIVGEERGFTGHTEDVNSDLVYMQQRYYDPSIGRFLSIDPREASPNDPMTFNRYAYANNNPYKYTDPDGRYATDYYSEADVGKYMSNDVDILIETGQAQVVGSDFGFDESRDHFKNGNGVPVVYTADLPVETMGGREPYPAGCQGSGDASSCKREVTTTGADWIVHGRVTVNINPVPGLDTIDSESYDFNHDSNASLSRNTYTFIGGLVHGSGHPYTIHYTGRPQGQYR